MDYPSPKAVLLIESVVSRRRRITIASLAGSRLARDTRVGFDGNVAVHIIQGYNDLAVEHTPEGLRAANANHPMAGAQVEDLDAPEV